ncbi:hypothetical protein O181_024015 [Austropuccinia psidii MF-1]|uniref:Integrase zinc-binding domain-containing protein n=1 Tax=Austropuccinia psidii MF-1 TaxID=1389203 RepID=A0A9Q3GZN6_9BASI|nr:hypothetical protein [Austropuccinia psidii MF-1]
MGHMSEDMTKERVTSKAWCPLWEQEFSEYINTCERCQKESRKDGKEYGLLHHIKGPKHPWETIHMDWVTGLVPESKETFNYCLVMAASYSKAGPKIHIRFWTNLCDILWTKLAVSTAYHPQPDGLAERMIQTMEDIIRRFCAYGMEYKDHEGHTHYWVILFPEVQLAYSTNQRSTTGKSPSLVEKGWNPLLPVDHLKKNILTTHPMAKDFHYMYKSACDTDAKCIAEAKE